MCVSNLIAKSTKVTQLLLFATAAWLMCGLALPSHQTAGVSGLMAKLGNLVMPRAVADVGGGSSDCLVCVPVSTTQLGQDIYTGDDKVDNKNGYHMVSMCHTAGTSGTLVTLTVDYDSVPAFLDQGDSYGACSRTYVNTCAAMTSSGITTGIWVPSSTVGDDVTEDDYFNQIQAGTPSGLQTCSAAGSSHSYRDIRGN